MNLWVIDGPYGVIGLANTIGAAVRLAEKECPDAIWERLSRPCFDSGYLRVARRNFAWPMKDGRQFDYLTFKFKKFSLKPSPSDTDRSIK